MHWSSLTSHSSRQDTGPSARQPALALNSRETSWGTFPIRKVTPTAYFPWTLISCSLLATYRGFCQLAPIPAACAQPLLPLKPWTCMAHTGSWPLDCPGMGLPRGKKTPRCWGEAVEAAAAEPAARTAITGLQTPVPALDSVTVCPS